MGNAARHWTSGVNDAAGGADNSGSPVDGSDIACNRHADTIMLAVTGAEHGVENLGHMTILRSPTIAGSRQIFLFDENIYIRDMTLIRYRQQTAVLHLRDTVSPEVRRSIARHPGEVREGG